MINQSKPNHFLHDSLGDPETCTGDHNHPEPEGAEQTELQVLAKTGYEAYAEHQNWKAYNGSPIPAWDAVRGDVKEAWEVAALAIATASA